MAMLMSGWTPNGRNAVCSTTIATNMGWTCSGGTANGGSCGCYCWPSTGGYGVPGAPPYPTGPTNCPAGSSPGLSAPAVISFAGGALPCTVTVYSCP